MIVGAVQRSRIDAVRFKQVAGLVAQGGGIVGVEVTATNVGTKLTYRGTTAANGEYVIYLDDDDVAKPWRGTVIWSSEKNACV